MLCKYFLVWWSPLCLLFSFVPLSWGDLSEKILLWTMCEILLPVFSFKIVKVSSLTFGSSVHFEFILVCGIRRLSSFIFLHISAQFSQHHLSNKLSLPHCMCLLLCWMLIIYKGVGLFLGSLFCSNDLCVCFYASTRLFWLQWPCNTVWYQVLWSLLLCSSLFISKLLQLFGVI